MAVAEAHSDFIDCRPSVFDNLSFQAFDDAFSDGLTDEMAASISNLDGVRVAGRRSAYVFKGQYSDLRDIGSRLNVEAVAEGSVQRASDRTHVTLELNRTRRVHDLEPSLRRDN